MFCAANRRAEARLERGPRRDPDRRLELREKREHNAARFVYRHPARLEFRASRGFRIRHRLRLHRSDVLAPGQAERRYAGITHIDCATLTASEAERLVNYAADRKVGISGLGYYPNALSPVPDEAQVAVEQIHRVIDAAATMGVGVMNTFIGRDWKLSVDESWPRMVETWRPILEHAKAAGVKIGIENCPMLFTRDEWPGGKNLMTTPVIWRRMFKEFEAPASGSTSTRRTSSGRGWITWPPFGSLRRASGTATPRMPIWTARS